MIVQIVDIDNAKTDIWRQFFCVKTGLQKAVLEIENNPYIVLRLDEIRRGKAAVYREGDL